MNGPASWFLWGGLIIAWLLIPLIVIQYRRIVVPTRFEEIKDSFLRAARPGAAGQPARSVAWHYIRLFKPDLDDAKSQQELVAQFWYFHGWDRYRLPLIAVTLLSGLMLGFSGLWLEHLLDGTAGDTNVWGRIEPPFIMALWGAFVWSLYELWSRWKSGDLTPIEVFDVALRFVVAIPIGYAFSLLVFETVPSLAAFAASAFPLRDVRQLFRKQALQKLSESPQGQPTLVSKGYLGEILNGIGNDRIVRLEELNVETFLDLAYADPIRLMVKTGAPIRLVLAWIDQALLAVYVAPHKGKFDLLGMPCALDVREFYLAHCFDEATGTERDWKGDAAVKNLATTLSVPLENLPQMLRSIYHDPHVKFLAAAWYDPV